MSESLRRETVQGHSFPLVQQQRDAWRSQIEHLKLVLDATDTGLICFEFAIPRMGRRADVVLFCGGVVVVIEYKVHAKSFYSQDREQAVDYAVDLKNFHEGSHDLPIVPVLVATEAPNRAMPFEWSEDGVAKLLLANSANLSFVFEKIRGLATPEANPTEWIQSSYKPTPTIIEAARALYAGHGVADISRSDAGAINLAATSTDVGEAIDGARAESSKVICFVTGVPGSGKTLAGLNLATERLREDRGEPAVFLSGNAPLVEVLREALARDLVAQAKADGQPVRKKDARRESETFVQNIHHFRDEALRSSNPPHNRVAVFDEAQRAWNTKHLARFMQGKKGVQGFEQSEPEFLLSYMDRHSDWCAVVCLIGGGQEIHTGEAGLAEWFQALVNSFPHWRVVTSDRILKTERSVDQNLEELLSKVKPLPSPSLHLSTSIRSFRAEAVSDFVSSVIDGDAVVARALISKLDRYPIVLTRDLSVARNWLRLRARGSERFGLVASSNGIRLKPVGLHVKTGVDVASWFLNEKGDVRSSYALEDVATEFDIQGLELDWVGVCWDANFRRIGESWVLQKFSGTKWKQINNDFQKSYLANAYRVLLTRARQGMVIFVPDGDTTDPTRSPEYYDGTFEFLRDCGIPVLDS